MEKQDNPKESFFPKDFFKQFKSKEEFRSFFDDLFKRGVGEMLQAELDEHLGYEKYSKEGHHSGPHRSWEFNIRQNGVIINSDMYGYPASHYSAPMESFEKIELIRGTGSLQYGGSIWRQDKLHYQTARQHKANFN